MSLGLWPNVQEAVTHASTATYNFEFTVPSKQVRMEEWIEYAQSRGDGFDLTTNLTLWLSANARHLESPEDPHHLANQTCR